MSVSIPSLHVTVLVVIVFCFASSCSVLPKIGFGNLLEERDSASHLNWYRYQSSIVLYDECVPLPADGRVTKTAESQSGFLATRSCPVI